MPFLLHRKWTLPLKNKEEEKPKNVSWNVQDKNMSFWSIPENQKQTDEEGNETQKIINHIEPLKFSTFKQIEEMELAQKAEETNSYTVSFLDPHQSNILPNIRSINKAKKLLATAGQFMHFQKSNMKYGVYHSAMEEIQRKEESYFHRLSISSKAQIKTRKNLFELMNSKNKSQSTCNFVNNASGCSMKVIEGSAQSLNSTSMPVRQSLKQPNKLRSKTHDRWKLKDFYDPLLAEFLTDKAKHMALQERQKYMKMIKSIEEDCDKTSAQNQVNKYIQIFGRFSDAIDSKLIKKQRKLDKVKVTFGRLE